MLASFFEVDVWLSREKGEQPHPGGKRGPARGAGGRAGGTECAGSPVTALLARPVRDRRPTYARRPRARKPALDDKSEGERHGRRQPSRVKKSGTAAREGVSFSLRRRGTFGASTHDVSGRHARFTTIAQSRIHQEMTKRGSLTLCALLLLPGL